MTNFDRIATIAHTQAILERHDFSFKKSYGQNFLTDHNILGKITAAAALDQSTNVIEIGPGIGSLTQYLLEEAAEVMAFEIDKTLIPILEETLAPYDNFRLVHADVLKVDLREAVQNFQNPTLPLKVIANLPYYITTPILMRLIESKLPFVELVVMMQKEVADRIAAQPNSKAYGSLSIAVQYYLDTEIAFIVPPTVFIPAPAVDSALVRLKRRPQPLVVVQDETFFFKIVKIAFAHRRKTLLNNLLAGFGKENKKELENCVAVAALSPLARAESLTIAEFGRLADALLGFRNS